MSIGKLFWIDSQGRARGRLFTENKINIPELKKFRWRTEDTEELYIDLCTVDIELDLLVVGRLFTDGRIQMFRNN